MSTFRHADPITIPRMYIDVAGAGCTPGAAKIDGNVGLELSKGKPPTSNKYKQTFRIVFVVSHLENWSICLSPGIDASNTDESVWGILRDR